MSIYGVTTPLASFTALIARHVPHCPEFLKEREVVRAIADFCKSSRSWRATIEDITLSHGDKWIDANRLAKRVNPFALAYAVDDILLTDDNYPLRRLSLEDMDRTVSGWTSHEGETPVGFMLYADRRVRLYPAMSEAAADVTADIELVLMPGPNITVLPDYIFNFHQDAVIHMAAFRLLTLVGMPWSDPGRAEFHFNSAQAETKNGNNERAKRAVDSINDRARRIFYR